MNKEIIKSIDNIVWFIPIKKLRDSIRRLLIFRLETLSDIKKFLEFDFLHGSVNNNDLIIKLIKGGLSDQISHYCYGRYIELTYGRKVKYDVGWYNNKITSRIFELLNLFPDLNLEIANDIEIELCKNSYDSNYSMKKIYIYGLMPSQYFNDNIFRIIKNELDFDKYVYPLLKDKNLDYYNEIKSSYISIGIHIRRGDWMLLAQECGVNVPDENYFIKAIELISKKIDIKKTKLFFFSDSMYWVSENIVPKIKNKYNYALMSENDDSSGYLDLYLLMQTQHQISSVGGFCRKAHFFNSYKNKIFIAPSDTMDMEPKISDNSVLIF